MQASDFRIGNLVSDEEGNLVTIFNILQSYCRGQYDNELKDQLLYYENIKPIPLTEEWLLNFRFEYSERAELWYFGDNPVTHDWMITIKTTGDGFFYKNGYFKIKYVHQLQNIYHALTGEDLVSKE